MKTILHLSDLHFGRVDPAVAQGLLDDVASLNPTLTVISGDFTQRARDGQYRHAADYCRRLPSPQLVVPGNHDIPLYNLIRRFFFPLGRYRRHIAQDVRPVYQDEDLLVIGVNTARSFTATWDGFWKDGRISAEQLLDVKLRACDLPPHVFKVVVTHHPFIPPPGNRPHGIVHGAPSALRTFEQCGVDMLLAGHLHRAYSGDVRGHHETAQRSILSIQAGTAISTRRRDEPNAYNLIHIQPHHVQVQVRAWDGRAFAPLTTVTYQRTRGIWSRSDAPAPGEFTP